jgi:hypothetical protein
MGVETILCASLATHDIPITFALPTVARRKVTAAFDGDGSPPTPVSCCCPLPNVAAALRILSTEAKRRDVTLRAIGI